VSLPVARQSPSGPLAEFSATSDEVENVSGVPGTTVTDALDYLYARSVQYLDQQDGPVALWNFNDTLAAVVGPTLALTSGTYGFTDVYPGVRGLWVNTGGLLSAPLTPNLQILGAMSVEVILQMQTFPPQAWVCGVGGAVGSELAADNVSWSIGLPSVTFPMPMRAFWEQGAGVDVTFDTSTTAGQPGYPFIHQIESIGLSRTAGGIVQCYMGGKPFGAPSTALTMPTGGGSGVFTVGAQSGGTSPQQPMIISIAVYNRARSAAEFLASYNRSVGLGLGFVT
jgi:hypothetical protein